MTREDLIKTIHRCVTEGSAECEECPLRGAKGDCIETLLLECEEEIIFLEGLLNAQKMLEDALRKQLEKARKELDGWKTGRGV